MNEEKISFALKTGRRLFSQDYSYQAVRNRKKALEITEHLKRVHQIRVPITFAEQLLTAHLEMHRSALCIQLKTIDAIVDACELFEEYVIDFNQLVCAEVLSMVKIHTCVISKNSLMQELVLVRTDLPIDFQAIVRRDGSVYLTANYS